MAVSDTPLVLSTRRVHGLLVHFTDRGFSADLRGLERRTPWIRAGLVAFLVSLVWVVLFSALLGRIVDGGDVALFTSLAATWAGFFAVLRRPTPGRRTTIEFTGDCVNCTSVEGRACSVPLNALEFTEPTSWGVALHATDGTTIEVAMTGAGLEARRWVSDELTARSAEAPGARD